MAFTQFSDESSKMWLRDFYLELDIARAPHLKYGNEGGGFGEQAASSKQMAEGSC